MPVRLDLHLVDDTDGTPVSRAVVTAEVSDPPLSFTSDADGLAVIELPEVPRHLALRVRREGFVPVLVVWDLNLGRTPWPEHHTLQLSRAKAIGGTVRNQRGEPVAGAQVLVTLGNRSAAGVQPRLRHDIYETPVDTDAEGRWQFKEAPTKFEYLHIRLAHPDYLSRHYSQAQPLLEECQRGTAVSIIPDGIPCEGTVTDEQGRPIVRAKVIVGEGGNGSDVKDSRRTDEQGRFRFGGISFDNYSEPQILSFTKKGFAPELVTLPPSSTLVSVHAVMKPGRKLSVRFTDEDGAPLPGVFLAMSSWRSHRPFHRHFQSDENGLAVWEDAPPDAVIFSIMKEGFQREEMQLVATEDVQTVVLRRPLMISGRVIDARTRQPIPHFSLVRGERRGNSTFWNHHWVYPYENGAFRAGAGDRIINRNRDGAVEEGVRFLRVSAPGYRAAISRPIANDETGELIFDFELEPAGDITGVICDTQGQPVAGAKIAIASGERPLSVRNGEVHDRGHFIITTGTDGCYTLAQQEEDYPLVIAHPRAGYRRMLCSELNATPDAILRPWARVELLTTSGPDEVSNYRLDERIERGAPRSPVRFTCGGNRTGEGVLLFEAMPEGMVRLFVGRSSLRRDQLTLVSGETLRIDRRTGRRTVIGRLALPPHGITSHPNFSELHVGRPVRRGTPADQIAEQHFEVPFEIDLTGQFRVDDLEPGSYEVKCTFYQASLSRKRSDIEGVAHKDFELPPGNGPFDLGVIPVEPPSDPGWGLSFVTG